MKRKNTGLVIKIDGIDGCGKTTLIQSLVQYYCNQGYSTISIEEFGINEEYFINYENNSIGLYDFLRKQAMSDDNDLDEIARELLWIIITRRTNRKIIKNSLYENDIIFVDRSNLCNIAYGTVIEKNLHKVFEVLTNNSEIIDMLLWIDTSVDICGNRLSKRKMDRIELRGVDYFNKVRQVYKSYVESNENISYRLEGNITKKELLSYAIEIIDKKLTYF